MEALQFLIFDQTLDYFKNVIILFVMSNHVV